jgi:hypothetical protein
MPGFFLLKIQDILQEMKFDGSANRRFEKFMTIGHIPPLISFLSNHLSIRFILNLT